MTLAVGDGRNVQSSLVSWLRGDADIAALHLYDSWDDVIATMDTADWKAPAICVELIEAGTPYVRELGGVTLRKPFTFGVSYFGADGDGARANRDDYLSLIRRRLTAEDVAGGIGHTIPVHDYNSNALSLLGYAKVQEIQVVPTPSDGAPPQERYRGEVLVRLVLDERKVTWYGA